MKIHMIGHATLLIETVDRTILMDPILGDPHQEGLFDITPQREVLLDRFPKLDMIVLSHKHLDHFDIRSLARLPKNVAFMTPKDPLLKHYLEKLGFSRITQVADFSVIRTGQTTLMTTRSENAVPEYGVVFTDPSGVFWNQVDTILSPQTVTQVIKQAGAVDLLLASWQPMMEARAQLNQSLDFPYSVYQRTLYNLSLVETKALAPGANGFRYRGESSWLNHVVFPLSREQFLHDAETIKPTLRGHTYTFEPGDVLELDAGETSWSPKTSPYVVRQDDGREFLDFIPVDPANNLQAQSSPDFDPAMVESALDSLRDKLNRSSSFSEHSRWNVIYQLNVVYPDRTDYYHCDFAQSRELVAARHPRANLVSLITAQALGGLAAHDHGWDYCLLGGYYRTFNRIYLASPNGLLRPPTDAINDPLAAALPYETLFRAMLDRELERWMPSPAVANAPDQLVDK
jgi:UDP-MurNAc hydroxylase